MSIRTRLRLSYTAMLLIPIALSILVTIVIGLGYKRSIENAYNVKLHRNPYTDFMNKSAKAFKDVRDTAERNPSLFEDMDYLNELDKNLSLNSIGIIVRKDNKIIFSSKFVEKLDIYNELPRFGSYIDPKHNHTLIGDTMILMRQNDFYFNDKSPGSIFLITDTTYVKNTLMKFILTDIIAILLILLLTNGVLTYLVSKSIVKPLESLKNAAVQIKEGNLDFEVKSYSKDEIGEVCSAFEDMRHKLKESVEVKSLYEKDRKELISNISHDLKTPITAIKGYVEGIMDGVADSPEKMERYIKTIYNKANDLDRLIDELFLFSKLDLNKLPSNFENVDITSYLEDSIEELRFDLEKKNIQLNYYTLCKSPLMVVADRERLKRVIINVVDNSIKHMNKNDRQISIRLEDDGKFIKAEIHDNGSGIAESDLPHIFDRFYRADLSRNTSSGGSGLGLAIAKLIIEEHGGKIWAASEENKGTSIFFTLKKV